jgi:hypothetical protein
LLGGDLVRLDLLVLLHRHEVRVFAADFAAVDLQPARFDQHLALSLEVMTDHFRDPRRHPVFGGREEHRQEALHDQVVKLLFRLGQILRRLRRRDDCEVVADLRVIEDALVRLYPALVQDLFGIREIVVALLEHAQRFLDRIHIVFRQRARVGPGIGQHLVLFVQRLSEAQRVLRRKAEAAVGLTLQAGQVEERRRQLRGRLRFFRHRADLATAGRDDRLSCRQRPQTGIALFRIELVAFEFRIEPAAFVEATGADEVRLHFPVIARHEAANLFFAFDDDRQRRCLHPPDRGQEEAAALAVERGHGPRAVDADQPVRFRTAARRVGERLHFFVATQTGKTVADRAGCHRLKPQALHRLFGFRVLRDQAENQLALAPRVTCVDQTVDVFTLEQLGQHLQARLALGNRIKVEMWGDDGQIGETPLAALDFIVFGRGDFQQVANCRGKDVVVAFVVFVMLGKAAQSLRDVVRDGRLFGDDQCFGHDSM